MIVSLVASSEHHACSGILSNWKNEDKNCASGANLDFVRSSSGKEVFLPYNYVEATETWFLIMTRRRRKSAIHKGCTDDCSHNKDEKKDEKGAQKITQN